ncbi:MAG: hypothetical protein ABIS36_09950, partial [Chryseolinea sp.]
ISKSILMRKLSGQASLMAVSETAPTAELLSDVLIGSAEANISLGKYPDAIEECNNAIRANPASGNAYKLRAIANSKLGNSNTVCQDISKAKRLGATEIQELERQFCQ